MMTDRPTAVSTRPARAEVTGRQSAERLVTGVVVTFLNQSINAGVPPRLYCTEARAALHLLLEFLDVHEEERCRRQRPFLVKSRSQLREARHEA
ncbi:MAG: hypothetical protein ACKV22_19810 [Bryobacteraceae bacterium]